LRVPRTRQQMDVARLLSNDSYGVLWRWNPALHGGIGSIPTFFSWWYNMCAVERQFDYGKLFSSPSFFLSLLLPKCEGVFSFIFYIQFGPYFFYCYSFLHILLINFLFNYIPHHLVLFYFYIKFGPYFFYFLKAFTNWILFSISSLNIWF